LIASAPGLDLLHGLHDLTGANAGQRAGTQHGAPNLNPHTSSTVRIVA
jgi:hypothetical protein